MGLFQGKLSTTCQQNSQEGILESKIKYINPPSGSNVARELINTFKRHSHKTLIVDSFDGSREYSGLDLWRQTARLASGLMESDLKLGLGEPVLLMCEHSMRELIFMYASLYSGASIIGTATDGFQDMKVVCEPTKPQVLVTSNKLFELAKYMRSQISGMSEARIVLLEANANEELNLDLEREQGVFLADSLFQWPKINESLIEKRTMQEIDPKTHFSMLMPTSGSTGRSKIVPWTHKKQLKDIWSILSATKQAVRPGHRPLIPLDASLVLAGDLPLDQGAGVVAMLWCLIMGGKYVLIDSYDEEKFWLDVARHKLTGSIASATFTYRLLRKLKSWLDNPASSPLIANELDISSMKYIACVGLKVNLAELMSQIRLVHKSLEVTQFLGATELGFITMLPVEDARQGHLDSVGYLFPGVRAKVVDLKTNACCLSSGEEGEMLVWSPSLFDSYLPHPEEKLEDVMKNRFDEQGFYRTGDIVHYDAEQRFYIHGRLKDTLYLDQDWKVPPSELEAIINEHPLVDFSTVVGIPNPEVENCVLARAFIKLKRSEEFELTIRDLETKSSILEEDRKLIEKFRVLREVDDFEHQDFDVDLAKKWIFDFTGRQLTESKRLHGGIKFLKQFPTVGALNKIDRRTLESMTED